MKYVKKPVSLVCKCSKPMSLSKLDDGRWLLACLECNSPMYHGCNAGEVLNLLHLSLEVQESSCETC